MSFRAYDLLNLVQDFGETLTLSQITTGGTYDPATGSISGSSTTETTFTGYMYDYSLLNPSEVIRGTRKCVIPSLGFTPEPSPDDLISGSGDTVKISRVVTIWSAGAAVCYLCDVEE
tara:strand:+ start:240 stop:590 length:351 start_codon:yes stop_codon:yes gene_type:complete